MEEVWNWVGWGVAFLATIVAIRGTVRFDVNEWLRDRRKQKEQHLRMLCPHIRVSEINGTYTARSTYISPSGTAAWQCQVCGDVSHDEEAIDDAVRYWASNPEKLRDRNQKMAKLAKKLGRS